MSAPRRPGDDRRAGRRPSKPGAPRDRRPAPARSDEDSPRPGKQVRVRKDGSLAVGSRAARQERDTGQSDTKAAPGRRRSREEGVSAPARPRGEGRPQRRDGDDAPRAERGGRRSATGAGDRRPRRDGDTAPRGNRRPAEGTAERAPRQDRKEAPRSDRDGRRSAEGGADRRLRRDGSEAPRTGRRPPEGTTERRPRRTGDEAPRPERRGARTTDTARPPRSEARPPRPTAATRERPAKPVRVRKDGSVATGGEVAREERASTSRREPQRIAKLLARAGIASRREIERMIAEGRIALDGQVLDTPATLLPTLRGVTVDGQPVDAPDATRLFLFHKPIGFLTTEHDPAGRPTIYDRLPEGLPRVMPIGRLDMNTEGLLLLTNDGEFKRKLELPSSGIPRTYRARAYGEVSQDQLEALSEGVEIEGIRYGSIDANLERRTGRNVWIEMRITEGKNREVRRVLEYLGLQVSRLIRVAYGEFVLADLPAGEVVEVRQNDLVEFRKTLR